LNNAGIDAAFMEKNAVGILYGNDSSALPVVESVDILRKKKDTMMIGSGYIFQSMNSNCFDEPLGDFQVQGNQFHDKWRLRQRIACNRYRVSDHPPGITGGHCVRGRPGDQPGVDCKFCG